MSFFVRRIGANTFSINHSNGGAPQTVIIKRGETVHLVAPTDTHLKTYEEWQALGRQVKMGSKARSFNSNNKALFHEAQTKPLTILVWR